MTSLPQTWTVYALASSLNGKPFYIGKGKGARIYHHEWQARAGWKSDKCEMIRRIWKQGGEIQRYILLETTDEVEALTYEKEMIALYGRDNLTNKTAGGQGVSGHTFSPEVLEHLSVKSRERWQDPVWRASQLEKMHAARQTPEVQAVYVAAAKAIWDRPGHREKMTAAQQQVWEREGYREKQSARVLAMWASPEFYMKRSADAKAQFSDPEYRAKRSALSKAKWADPEYRARMIAQRNTPEARAKKVAAWERRKARQKDKE